MADLFFWRRTIHFNFFHLFYWYGSNSIYYFYCLDWQTCSVRWTWLYYVISAKRRLTRFRFYSENNFKNNLRFNPISKIRVRDLVSKRSFYKTAKTSGASTKSLNATRMILYISHVGVRDLFESAIRRARCVSYERTDKKDTEKSLDYSSFA